jgi:hypothetical protein
MSFPIIDGHFWVERDYCVIDPYFPEYEFIKRVNRLEGEPIHLEADAIVSQVMIRRFESVIATDLFGKMLQKARHKNRFGACYQNAILEISKNGGRLVFGSMGWKRKGSDSIHWEFGGENWKVSQFLKQ